MTRLAGLLGEGEAAKETAKQQLKYLEEPLSLIRTVKPANQPLRVSLDPLAKYLAGLYLVEQYRDDEAAWQKFLVEAEEKPGTVEEIRGFLLAVRECCLVKAAETKVPDFVAEKLAKLAGLDPEALEQERLNRRIRYLISGLSSTNANDRGHAIDEISKIGSAARSAAIPIAKLLRDGDNPGSISHSSRCLAKSSTGWTVMWWRGAITISLNSSQATTRGETLIIGLSLR
ncbi:hypothetical protein [Leptolyngbya sp. FACHB-17]|uniref:hypothetical protein n=1 Tax=unclassified Leptolyngbya TaxID=2650499 RepID=UPI001681B008|nr:hypothetical protein [Leptolyngbya sp. FACHB-17]MBD2080174.1 hypothetical protein [Leptolyngbya sp. FACHB-17]